jgi:hypothetical protein
MSLVKFNTEVIGAGTTEIELNVREDLKLRNKKWGFQYVIDW